MHASNVCSLIHSFTITEQGNKNPQNKNFPILENVLICFTWEHTHTHTARHILLTLSPFHSYNHYIWVCWHQPQATQVAEKSNHTLNTPPASQTPALQHVACTMPPLYRPHGQKTFKINAIIQIIRNKDKQPAECALFNKVHIRYVVNKRYKR